MLFLLSNLRPPFGFADPGLVFINAFAKFALRSLLISRADTMLFTGGTICHWELGNWQS
jgi:hypothetical protein